MDIEAAAAFGVINAPSLLNPLKVFATISAKAAITNKVNNQQNNKINVCLFYQYNVQLTYPWIYLHFHRSI